MLVSAYHNITGSLTSRSKDGVGAVVMNNSDDTYRLAHFIDYLALLLHGGAVQRPYRADGEQDHARGDGLGFLLRRQQQRCAQRQDFDMCVRKPDNANLICSNSLQNAWSYDPSPRRARPVRRGGDPHQRRLRLARHLLGIAWSTRVLPDFCTGVRVMMVSAGGMINNVSTANGTTFFDSYAGWSFLQSGRDYACCVSPPTRRRTSR